MIVRHNGKYRVISKRTKRNFGTYKTLKEAKKRLKTIEYFKNLNK